MTADLGSLDNIIRKRRISFRCVADDTPFVSGKLDDTGVKENLHTLDTECLQLPSTSF